VLGLVPGRSGWVGASLEASGHGTPHIVAGSSLADVVAQAGPVTVVAVNVPMGLPDDSRRAADAELRRFLGPQSSVVVGAPVRDAVYAVSDSEANRVNRERAGAGVSRQASDLRPRITEVDGWLRQDLPHRVVEVVPEASLAVMTGAPLESRRGSAAGGQERREALGRAGIYVPVTAPHGVSAEDVVAACAAAWTAHRVKTGESRSFPEQAETFSDGIPAAVHA
jgi:predicted RNase H-like nuclease